MQACERCDEPIVWVKTAGAEVRHPISLNAAEVPHDIPNALILVDGYAYGLERLTALLSEQEAVPHLRARELIAERYTAHLAHFATCNPPRRHA